MIDLNDFIKNKYNQKKYKFYCAECGKDRGYLFKSARGGRKTGSLCVQCKNGIQHAIKTGGHCKYCKIDHDLPEMGASNSHWYWEVNLSSIEGGYFRCKIQISDKNRKWIKNNPIKYKVKQNATAAKYRASKLMATPSWLTKQHLEKIQNIYKEAKLLEEQDGIKRHVDHIIPLQGKNICGLHVPCNLRITTAEDNLTKSNKLLSDIINSESYLT